VFTFTMIQESRVEVTRTYVTFGRCWADTLVEILTKFSDYVVA
jgi:hypothetical protein